MSKNNGTIINGVSYDLSLADTKLLQDIISRSRVRGNVRESAGNQNISPVTEKLNATIVERLIGHNNVVYYNYETGSWNTSTYNGYAIKGQKTDTEYAQAFKAAMEKMPEFSAQYEMAASVTMTIDRKFYPGWRKTISNPQYSNNGAAVVGNIIVKNKTTGKYEWYGKSWVGVDDYLYPNVAVIDGAYRFACDGATYSDFRKNLIAAHLR